MIRCDFHTHTCFSFDAPAEATPDALCRRALEAGLSDIAITDHCDINGVVEGIYEPFDQDGAWEAMAAVKEKYKGRLNVVMGMELGNAPQYPEAAAAAISRHPYEFVIGSLHCLKDVPDFYFLNYDEMTDAHIDRLFTRALNETVAVCETSGITTLGHLTYMHRYVTAAGKRLDFKPHYDQIAAIYDILIARDVALELNVSTLWKGLGIGMPTLELLKLYADRGGKLVTIGSDAHEPANVGKAITKGYALLNAAGLHQIMVIRDGARVMESIE